MVNTNDIDDDRGSPDLICGTCGHASGDHLMREIEVAGNTIREMYCESCDARCEFIPEPDDH